MRRPVALLSVYDKKGIVGFAAELLEQGFDLISSGGTAKVLHDAGFAVRDVAETSGLPPILDHRVVTLVPQIHGGLLALPKHLEELERLGFPWIDLVCVDLYPLEEAVAKPDATTMSVIEATDIGGPTMLRSGAKGRRIVVCDPDDRDRVIQWFKQGRPYEERFVNQLAAKAEFVVAKYCLTSAKFHSGGDVDGMNGEVVEWVPLTYGENPWLKAKLYRTSNHPLALHNFIQIAGRPTSFVNQTDLDAQVTYLAQLAGNFEVNGLDVPLMAVAVKHGTACGMAVGTDPNDVIARTIDGDPGAIFGGFVMANFPIGMDQAQLLRTYRADGEKRPLDGVVAPSFDDGASDILERKDNRCRMIVNPALTKVSGSDLLSTQYRVVRGGFLRQEGKPFVFDLSHPQLERFGDLTRQQQRDLLIAHAAGSRSRSNTITLVRDDTLVANAVGQQSRIRAASLALMVLGQTGNSARKSVAYSDSFFPFPDAAMVLVEAGVSGIFASSSLNPRRDDRICDAIVAGNAACWRMPDAICRGFSQH